MYNNPLIPGDPYMYDIKWIVSKILQHGAELSNLDEKIRAAVIAALDQRDPIYFESADALINSGIKAGTLAYIEGYYMPGDGGANFYITTDDYNDIIGADFYITLSDPNKWAIPIILTPFVTPEMFGAKGDGVHNDTDSVNKAIKASNIIYFNKKTYLIDDVSINNPITIYGNGGTLKQTGNINATFITISSDNVIINDLIVDPNESKQTTTNQIIYSSNHDNITLKNCVFMPQFFTSYNDDGAIRFEDCNNISLTDCELYGANGEGVIFDGVCNNCKINGGYYHDNQHGSGIWLYDNTNFFVISGAVFENNEGSQIGVSGKNHIISNCYIINGGSYGITLGHPPARYAVNCIITDCFIYDNADRNILLQLAGTEGTKIHDCFIGYSALNVATFGVSSSSGALDVEINNCTFTNCGYAISANNNFVIKNNKFITNNRDIYFGGAITKVIISDNISRNSVQFIYSINTFTTSAIINNDCAASVIYLANCTESVISQNRITAGAVAFNIASSGKCVVSSNFCAANQRGIYMPAGADSFVGNICINNTTSDFTIPKAQVNIGNVNTNGVI